MYMQVGYLFIRKEHECTRNVLYLDPGDYPGKIFHMLYTWHLCTLLSLYRNKNKFFKET